MKILSLIFFLSWSFLSMGESEFPRIDLKTMDGKIFNAQEMSNGDAVTIISLWATWCVPCLKELDAINEVYPEWQEETNVKLYAVSVDDARTVKRVKPLINGKGWDYTILLDTNNDFQRAIGAATVPMTLLVKDNKIVYRHSGYSPGAEFALYEKIKEFSK